MAKTSIGAQIEPDVKERARDLAEMMGMSLSQYVAKAIRHKTSRDDAEWARIKRRIDRLDQKEIRALEDMEDRLLDRVEELSEAESRLLDAVQDELWDRKQEPEKVPA